MKHVVRFTLLLGLFFYVALQPALSSPTPREEPSKAERLHDSDWLQRMSGSSSLVRSGLDELDEVLFEETFDAGTMDALLAAGWVLEDGGTSDETWEVTLDFHNLGHDLDDTAPFLVVTAWFNDGGNTMVEDMITPVFDCSDYTTVLLDFDTFIWERHESLAELSVTVDGGETWISLFQVVRHVIESTSMQVDLSAFVHHQPQVQLRFHFEAYGSYTSSWGMDNISVTGATEDTSAPYLLSSWTTSLEEGQSLPVDAYALDNVGITQLSLVYGNWDGESFTQVGSIPLASEGADWYGAVIPAEFNTAGRRAGYRIIATDAAGNTSQLPEEEGSCYPYYVYASQVLFSDDFETDSGHWIVEEESWERGHPTAGPMGGMESDNVYATELDEDYGSYCNDPLVLVDRFIPLEGGALLFDAWWEYELGYDGFMVEVSVDEGDTWESVAPVIGYNTNLGAPFYKPCLSGIFREWHPLCFDLADFVGQAVTLRIRHVSDVSYSYYGAAIDNLNLVGCQSIPVVHGYTLYGWDNDPVELATVAAWDIETSQLAQSAVTDHQGWYEMSLLPGQYQFVASAFGHNDFSDGPYTIQVGDTLDLDLLFPQLGEWVEVNGTVHSADSPDTPVQGLMVSVLGTGFSTFTDVNGEFYFEHIVSGVYNIQLNHVPVGSQGYHDQVVQVEIYSESHEFEFLLPEILSPENVQVSSGNAQLFIEWDPPANHDNPDALQAKMDRIRHELDGIAGDHQATRKRIALRDELKCLELRARQLDELGEDEIDALEDFLGYRVFLDGELQPELYETEEATINGLINGHTYEVQVAADYGYNEAYLVPSDPVFGRPIFVDEVWSEPGEYNWVEIRPESGGEGTLLVDAGDDTTRWVEELGGFEFNFFGHGFDQLGVCSNGWISFTDSSETIYLTLPSTDAPNAVLAPLNLDTDLGNSEDDRGIWGWYDEENNRYVILFHVEYYSNPAITWLYEVILNGDDYTIEYQYNTASNGWTSPAVHLIGVEDPPGESAQTIQPESIADQSALLWFDSYQVTGSIVGTVLDDLTESPIPDVLVTVATQSGATRTGRTNEQGEYVVAGVDRFDGPYTVTFRCGGYYTRTIEGVEFEEGDGYTHVLDTWLHPPFLVSATGQVWLDEDPLVPADSTVIITGGDHINGVTSSNGSFLIEVGDGHSDLTFWRRGYRPLREHIFTIPYDPNDLGDFYLTPLNLHFDPVDSTRYRHTFVFGLVTFNGDTLGEGNQIAMFDGDLCVGALELDGIWPISGQAYGADDNTEQPGWTEGDSFEFQVYLEDEDLILPATAILRDLEMDTTFTHHGYTSLLELQVHQTFVTGQLWLGPDETEPADSTIIYEPDFVPLGMTEEDGSFHLAAPDFPSSIIFQRRGYRPLRQSVDIIPDESNDLGDLHLVPLNLAFDLVDSTSIRHTVMFNAVTLDGDTLGEGNQVALFDGDLCVGARELDGIWPIWTYAFGEDEEQGLPGFTTGDSMAYAVYLVEEDLVLPAWPVYTETDQDSTFSPRGRTQLLNLQVVRNSVEEEGTLPTSYALLPPYPNPFNGQVTIRYELPERAEVRLVLHTITGREVQTLRQGRRAAGRHQLALNLDHAPSGVYLLTLKAGPFKQTQRLVLVK